MKNLFRFLMLALAIIMLWLILDKDNPEILTRYNIPNTTEAQQLIEEAMDEQTDKTVEWGEENIGMLYYVGNDKIELPGPVIHPWETEVISRRWGEFGIQFNIRSIVEAENGLDPTCKANTTKIDSSGRRAKVLTYCVKSQHDIRVDNSWLILDRGKCYSYLAEVRIAGDTAQTSMLLEILLEKGNVPHPMIGVKLLNVRPGKEGDKKLFVFNDKRSFAYVDTEFKAIRMGFKY